MEELEAIKEAEEAALAEAEAAAVEAAQAMEGIFGDDPSGPDPGGGNESPGDSESASGTGPLVDIVGNSSPSRGSLTGSTAAKYMVQHANSFSQSVDGVNAGADNESDRISMSSAAAAQRYRSNENFNNGSVVHQVGPASGLACGGLGGSVSGTTGGKLTSLPASPFVQRASKSTSFSSHVRLTGKYGSSVEAAAAAAAAVASGGKKPLVLFTYLDAQEHLPYADDSTAVTPKSELNGGIVVDTPTRMGLARKLSYNSHTGKLVDNSYNSHTDLRYPPGTAGPGGMCSASGSTKEGILTKRMASLFNESIVNKNNTVSSPNSIVLEPITDGMHQRGQGQTGLYDNESAMVDPRRLTSTQNLQTTTNAATAAGADRNNFITNGNGKDSVDLQVSKFK